MCVDTTQYQVAFCCWWNPGAVFLYFCILEICFSISALSTSLSKEKRDDGVCTLTSACLSLITPHQCTLPLHQDLLFLAFLKKKHLNVIQKRSDCLLPFCAETCWCRGAPGESEVRGQAVCGSCLCALRSVPSLRPSGPRRCVLPVWSNEREDVRGAAQDVCISGSRPHLYI